MTSTDATASKARGAGRVRSGLARLVPGRFTEMNRRSVGIVKVATAEPWAGTFT